MDGLFIEDGYTATKTIAGVAGLHPDLTVLYRPALARERHAYKLKLQIPDPVAIESHETDLIAKFGVSVNGQDLRQKERVARLKPAVRGHVIDLILGFAPEDEVAAGKTPPSG